MKKIIKRFWGVAFIVVLLSSLFVAAVPQASAGVLNFTKATAPNDPGILGGITANNTNIYDFAVGKDNLTIYAATSNGGLKSTDGGRHWVNLTSIKILHTTHVAVAGDDEKYVAFLDQITNNITLSKDGGTIFLALGQARNGDNVVANAVTDIALSKSAEVAISDFEYGTSHVLAVSGTSNVSGAYRPALYYCLPDLIGIVGGWKDAANADNEDSPIRGQGFALHTEIIMNTVEFSPNFDRDTIAYCLSSNKAVTTCVYLHVLSFNNARWDTAISGFASYGGGPWGAALGISDANTPGAYGGGFYAPFPEFFTGNVTRAQIAFTKDFLGLEYESRVVYISIACTNDTGGCWQVKDNNQWPYFTQVASLSFPKLAYSSLAINDSGMTLVVAAMFTNRVWTIPMGFGPAMATPVLNNPMKRIGVSSGYGIGSLSLATADNQTVVYCGDHLFAAKQSTEGAFSISADDGYTFDDISLVDTSVVIIQDQVIAADGGNRYVISNDYGVAEPTGSSNGHLSVFFWDGTYWERTFCHTFYSGVTDSGDAHGYVAKASPTKFDILYLGDKNSAFVYFTAKHGTVNWKPYQSPKTNTTLADLEVESDAKLYVATIIDGKGYVSTLTENGRMWHIPDKPTFYAVSASDPLASLTLVSERSVIAGSTLGRLAYSTEADNNAAIWKCSAQYTGAANTFADAVSLANGTTIYVVFDNFGFVIPWTVGASSATPWGPLLYYRLSTTIDPSYTQKMYGILIYPHTPVGAVYAISSNGTATFGGDPGDTWLCRAFLPAMGLPHYGEWAATNIFANALFSADLFTAVPGQKPDVLKATTGNQIWFIDTYGTYPPQTWSTADRILTYTDTLYEAVPAPSSPIDKYLVQVNKETGLAYDVTLIWSVASAAAWYEYEVAKDTTFETIVLTGQVTTPYLFAPTANVRIGPHQTGTTVNIQYQPGETYYWRVRAVPYQFDASGWWYHFYSNWSPVYTLMIQPAPPPVPDLLSPANGGTVSTLRPGFSWSAMSGEAPASGITMTYTFQLATDTAFSTTSLVYTTTTTVAGLNLAVDLKDSTQYFWRVCTTTSVTGDWSAVANFNVSLAAAPTPPVQITQTSFTITQTNPPVTSITATHEVNEVSQVYIWVIIIIGAVLVIAIIVLIVRTRRVG